MKLMFIGTGSGQTSLKRNHSSILIKHNNHNLLIDCGDGTAKALMQRGVSFKSVDSILFSHYHADHFAGIASLITQMKLCNRENLLTLFTHNNLVEPLDNFIKYSYMFKKALGFDISLTPFDFNKEVKIIDDLSFTAKQNTHITNKHNVDDYDESKFVSSSFLLKTRDEEVVYTSDIGNKDDLFLFKDIPPEIFITETTHINFDWLLDVEKIIKPGKIILTHISDEDEFRIENWCRNLPLEYHKKILVAEDGHIVTLSG